MPGSTINMLAIAAALTGTEPVPVWQGSATKQATAQAIANLANPSSVAFNAETAYTPGSIGAKLRQFISVKDAPFLAKGDGVTDDTAAIQAAIAYVDANGGGKVYFPGPGATYATLTGIVVGNGSNSTVATSGNRIELVGDGMGSSTSVINQQVNGATRILYTGGAGSSVAVVTFAGPMYGVGLSDLELDCNSKAGIGVLVNHVTQAAFVRASCRNYTTKGWSLTTRTGYPTGCAFGCGDNLFFGCYGFIDDVTISTNASIGVSLTSGVSSGSSLVGNPDSARNTFIGGTFMYGTAATAYGFYLNGADNNNFVGCLPLLYGGGTSSGNDIYYQQWAGSGNFPLENSFSNVATPNGIGGNGGVGSGWGNTHYPLPTSDASGALPTIAGISGGDHTGKTFVAGVRAYRGRQIAEASSTTPQNTTSGTYGDITGYSVTLVTLASQLKIEFAGNAAKSTAGQGLYTIAVDGTAYGEAQCEIYATGGFGNVACNKLLAVSAGSHTVTVQFKSSDSNSTTLNNGTLSVQELY